MLKELFAFQDFYLDLRKQLPGVLKNLPIEHINLAQFVHLKMVLLFSLSLMISAILGLNFKTAFRGQLDDLKSKLAILGENGNFTGIFGDFWSVLLMLFSGIFLLTVTVEKLNSVMNSIICLFWGWF